MNAPTDLKAVGEIDRRTYIGSSDAAAIMGLGATYDGVTQTPYTVWCKKVSDEREEMDPSRRRFLDRRKRWEGPIREMLREEFSAEIVGFNQRYVDPEYPFLASEIDFEWRDPEDSSVQNGEIKTVHPLAYGERYGWGEPGTSDIPVQYAAQTMFGLGVTGRRCTVVPAMVGLDNLLIYRIDREDETIAAMREACVSFWENYVLTKIPPPAQTFFDVKQMLNRVRGRPVELTADVYKKLTRLRDVRRRLKVLEEGEKMLAFEVGDFILSSWRGPFPLRQEPSDNAVMRFEGKVVATWNKQRGAHLDQKRLKIEKPEIIRAYTKENYFRVLRFPKPKN